MAFEINTYEIECEHCGKKTEFLGGKVEGLADDVDDEITHARASERQDVEAEYSGMVDPDDLPIQPRTIYDLSAAIERGDKFEARILIERIAEDLGLEHKEAVQIGRYSTQAKVS